MTPASMPYTRTVSDVYQDLFGEGSFVGKGIYDVDAFEAGRSKGRVPENRILSHDLLRRLASRAAGLVGDVRLYEDFPSQATPPTRSAQSPLDPRRLAAAAVAVRPCGCRGSSVARKQLPLSWLSQWKVLDNLRRSWSRTGLRSTALLVTGWFMLQLPGALVLDASRLLPCRALLPAPGARSILPNCWPQPTLACRLLQPSRCSVLAPRCCQHRARAVDLACLLPYEALAQPGRDAHRTRESPVRSAGGNLLQW